MLEVRGHLFGLPCTPRTCLSPLPLLVCWTLTGSSPFPVLTERMTTAPWLCFTQPDWGVYALPITMAGTTVNFR